MTYAANIYVNDVMVHSEATLFDACMWRDAQGKKARKEMTIHFEPAI